jgi:Zn-dependent protease
MGSCRACGAALDDEALSCPSCHTLTHEDELTRLRTEALALERNGQFASARHKWLRMLHYLPPNTKQVGWLVTRIQELEGVANTGSPAAESRGPRWLARLGPIAPILLAIFKGKGLLALFNAKSLVSLGLFIGVYGQQFGWAFGAGFAVAILIHEMGHYIDIRRRGLPADMPVFLPGLGAYVRWRALGVSSVVRAEVSLAGPLAGLLAAIACAIIWAITGSPFWAALARAGAWLNVLNLTPVWALDGGQAATVLDRSQRLMLLTVAALLWLSLGEGVFLLVALGAVWRLLFTRDLPAQPSRSTAIYFAGVLAALGIVMYLLPGHGAGAL